MIPAPFHVRRGRRHDLSQVAAVLGVDEAGRLKRLYARVSKDLRTDVYVAEEPGGQIVGIVALLYARSLFQGGPSAVLDGARARSAPVGPVLDGLVAFAEERARRRGCRRLCAWSGALDADLRTTLLARGYRAGEMLVADLGGEVSR
jgi:hypothetical protein